MTTTLRILRSGPGVGLQDQGRPGLVHQGLSTGGAADPLALLEARALLRATAPLPAVEMPGTAVAFTADTPLRFALTGAPMRAHMNGRALQWNASHLLPAGSELQIGGAQSGVYGYLSFAAPILPHESAQMWQGSLSPHFAAGLGAPLGAGQRLTLGPDPFPEAPSLVLPVDSRFDGGTCRVMPGPQSALFDAATIARFQDTLFTRSPRGNRQGVGLDHSGAPFASTAAPGLLSDFIAPGDIQMTGPGLPYVLMCECQTIGGYPRLGTVLPDDLPRIAQCPPGASLRFRCLTETEARDQHRRPEEILRILRTQLSPLLRAPGDIADLLGYQLISGVTSGDDLDH